jgi:predicted Zn-dependent protease
MDIQVAAASLALSHQAAPEMLPLLERALTAKTQMSPDAALESAYIWTAIQVDEAAAAKAEPVARRLTETFPASAEATALYMQVLMKQNKLAEAENVAIKFTKAEGDDPAVTNWLINCYESEKRFKDSAALALKMSSGEKATTMSYNLMGWDAVLAHAVPPETLEAVQHAATSNASNAPLLHTLAMMYAEVGKGREARSMAAQAMANWGLTEPNSEIWLIYGRIAEDYGLTEEARSAYRKVESPIYKALTPDSTSFAIAQERLKLLEQRTNKPIN